MSSQPLSTAILFEWYWQRLFSWKGKHEGLRTYSRLFVRSYWEGNAQFQIDLLWVFYQLDGSLLNIRIIPSLLRCRTIFRLLEKIIQEIISQWEQKERCFSWFLIYIMHTIHKVGEFVFYEELVDVFLWYLSLMKEIAFRRNSLALIFCGFAFYKRESL